MRRKEETYTLKVCSNGVSVKVTDSEILIRVRADGIGFRMRGDVCGRSDHVKMVQMRMHVG